eukprot:TRINITY_DN9029_c0_g1_i1.p1 TRINITY_DN9029_c0_g1~~TRINITY_DN9029_c0_g1_i1.p1  ORF type:complete len:375 (+),score=74.85 TRINITY_DN9029_c0_g1_i1:40-1164(+)
MSKLWNKITGGDGSAKVEKDERFAEENNKFIKQNKLISGLTSDINGFIASADAMLTSMEEIAANLQDMAPPGSQMLTLCHKQVDTVKQMMNHKRSTLDSEMTRTFGQPIQNYMGQFRELGERIRERNRRRGEVDKLVHTRDKQKAKGDPRLVGTETRLASTREAYKELNEELIRDIPLLVNDSDRFFTPIVSQLIITQASFWSSMSAYVAELQRTSNVQNVAIPAVVPVITPKNQSALAKRYNTTANPWGASAAATGGANPYGAPAGSPYGAPAAASPYGAPATAPSPYGAPATGPYGAAPGGPGLPPRPGAVPPLPPAAKRAQAQWAFSAQQAGEISFAAGDVINVTSSEGDWWVGELNGQSGSFPGNYVKML